MYPREQLLENISVVDYDTAKVDVVFNGVRLDTHYMDDSYPDDSFLEVLTDGENVQQVRIGVLQGSHEEDLLGQAASSGRLNVLVLRDRNDKYGALNAKAFAVRVRYPYSVRFGAVLAVRTFLLDVDNSDEAEDELADDSFFQEQDSDEAGFDGFGFYTGVDGGSELNDHLYT